MANRNQKYHRNSPGSFYVDQSCIACDACVMEAPYFFKIHEKDLQAYVLQQPKTEEEKKLCFNALKHCPVEAIGVEL